MTKKYFVEYERKTLTGGNVRQVERFEYEENRDIIVKGIERSPYLMVIEVGEDGQGCCAFDKCNLKHYVCNGKTCQWYNRGK